MLVLAVGNGERRRPHSKLGCLETMQMDEEKRELKRRDGRGMQMAPSVKSIQFKTSEVASERWTSKHVREPEAE